MAINAAVDGLGLVLESRMMLQRELDAGRLVLPLGDKGPRLACHSLLYLKSKASLPKIKIFREWLMAELAASERISGTSALRGAFRRNSATPSDRSAAMHESAAGANC